MSYRPPWRSRNKPQPFLEIKPIYFVNHSVDVIAEHSSFTPQLCVVLPQRIGTSANPHQRTNGESPTLIGLAKTRLCLGRKLGYLSPRISQKTKGASGSHSRIQ